MMPLRSAFLRYCGKSPCHNTGFTINKLSIICGITQSTLNNIMNGRNKTVTLSTILLLARGFHMTPSAFLDDEIFRSEELQLE
mgnify:CR=1 FL=1